jgi:hypothetical protein
MGYFDDVKTSPIPAFAPRQERKPNILDRVLGLYGSDPNTHIPEGQRNEALRTGLGAGAQALRAASMQGVPMSAFERIGLAMGGMGQAGQIMGDQQKKQKLEALLMSGSTADLQLAFRQALASGDNEMAQLIGQQLQAQMKAESAKQAGALSQPKGQVTQKMMGDGQYHNVLLDMVTGDVVQDLGPVQPDAGVVVDRYNPDTGVTEKVLVDRKTGELISKVGETAPKGPGQYESEALSRLNQFSIALDNIESGLDAMGNRAPSFYEWEMYNSRAPGFLRSTVPDEVQGMLQAQNVIVTQIAKEIGGVRGAASPTFRNVIARTYLIAPGDSPTNIKQTLQSLRAMEEDLRRKATGAMTSDELKEKYGIEGDIDAMIRQDEEAGVYGMEPGFADEQPRGYGEDIAPAAEPLLGTWPE